MLRVLTGHLPGGSLSIFKGVLLAATTPTPDPADSASALPDTFLWALFGLVVGIVLAMFYLTWANLRKAYQASGGDKNATSSQPGMGTTRTTLAIVGFSLLGVAVIAVFGLSGQGVRDLRNQVIGAVVTLVATIAGFYFGARTAQSSAAAAGPTTAAPGLALQDPNNPNPPFTVGQAGTYTPIVTGTPPPTVSLAGTLPTGLKLDARTGAITGTPASGTAGEHRVTLTASNGISPDATLNLTLKVSDSPAPALPDPKNPNPQPTPGPS